MASYQDTANPTPDQIAKSDPSKRAAPGSSERAQQDHYYEVQNPQVQAETFQSPGSAEFGGVSGGADIYKQSALNQMQNNDGEQNLAGRGMSASLANMQANRGPGSVENANLVGAVAGSRANQLDAMNLMGKTAAGGSPSVARYQTTQGMNDIMSGRSGSLGGARGLAGLNGAQGGSAAMGQGAGQLAAQGGQGRSNEIGSAIGAYGGMAGSVRGSDLSRIAQNNQNSQFNSNLNDNWKLGNANNAIAFGNLGNAQQATDQGYYGASMQPGEIQFANDQEAQGWQAGANTDKAALEQAQAEARHKSINEAGQGGAKTLLSMFGMGMGGSK